MRWRNAWIVMRKDLDEFTKQKLVIGSIVAMPIVLGVILPLIMFVPLTTIVPINDRSWDVPGLIQIGEFQGSYNDPWTNKTLNDTSIEYVVLQHVRLDN